jgi:hypothetical protein
MYLDRMVDKKIHVTASDAKVGCDATTPATSIQLLSPAVMIALSLS